MKNQRPLDLRLTFDQWIEVEEALTTKILCIQRGDMGAGDRAVDRRWVRDLESIRSKVQHLAHRD